MGDLLLLKSADLFGIEFFDKDIKKLVLLLLINFFVSFVLIRLIYYPNSEKKKQFLLSFMLISTVVFCVTFALKSFEFDTGMAIGLFAVFGILRFRTVSIPIREISYLFTVIGIALINALSKKLSLIEIGVIDGVVLMVAGLMEIFLGKIVVEDKKEVKKKEVVVEEKPVEVGLPSKQLVYGLLDNIKPANRAVLMEDLKAKTGLNIQTIEVGTINLKKGEAKLTITYEE